MDLPDSVRNERLPSIRSVMQPTKTADFSEYLRTSWIFSLRLSSMVLAILVARTTAMSSSRRIDHLPAMGATRPFAIAKDTAAFALSSSLAYVPNATVRSETRVCKHMKFSSDASSVST